MNNVISVNYVIATYAGCSKNRERFDKGITPFTLQLHLDKLIELLSTTSIIKQITITKPKVDVHYSYKEYYDIQDKIDMIEKKFNIPVEIIDMDNYSTGVSYSQYRRAFQDYPNFDFYILMEDDWIPIQKEFDILLIREWEERFPSHNSNAYLCLWYSTGMRRISNIYGITEYKAHAAISVGIISNKALTELSKWCKMNTQLDQYHFSLALQHIGTEIRDFSCNGENWKILFWETSKGIIYDFSYTVENKECLLAPLQYILKDKYGFQIVPKQTP